MRARCVSSLRNQANGNPSPKQAQQNKYLFLTPISKYTGYSTRTTGEFLRIGMAPKSSGVLMIGWEYPPHNSGGLGVACEGMTKAISELNTQIYFTLPYALPGGLPHMQVLDCSDPSWSAMGAPLNAPPFQAYDSIEPEPFQPASFVASHELSALPQSEMETKVDEYAQLVSARAADLKHSYDVIHAHDWMSFPAAKQLKEKTGKPVIVHVHSTEYDRIPSGNGSPYIMQTEYEGMQIADQVVAVSFYTKQLLTQKYSIDPRKITVIHNGIDPLAQRPDFGRHHFASKRPVIVFMGRLTAQKGTEYFVDLARQVLTRIPQALFIVAGSGDMYHELLFRTAGKQLTASVLFSGFVRDSQREKLLDRADIFVMPSLSEPFGLVALEAAQRHTPVVLSRSVGASEVMPSSIAVDFWDVHKMSDVIVELLNNRQYHESVVQQQLDDLQHITWDTAADRIVQLYRNTFLGA
jgi:glycogen(starch) synthase